MTSDKPLMSLAAAARSVTKRMDKSAYLAELLDDNGRVYINDNPGYVWVREILSSDASGGEVRGQAYQVRGTANFVVSYGIRVRVVYDVFDDEWEIERNDFSGLVAQDINPAITNLSSPYAKELTTLSLPYLLPYAVSNGETATTEIAIKNLLYLDYLGAQKFYSMSATDRPDPGDYEPAAGLKLLVHFWLNHDKTVTASTSTPIPITVEFSLTDLAEVIQNPPNQLALPIGVWEIQAAQTAVTPGDLFFDTRQFINQPQAPGLPNPIVRNYIIPAGTTADSHENVVVSGGNLEVAGNLIVHSHPPNITKTNIRVLEKLTANVFELDTPVWNDIFIGLSGAKVPAANAPTWATWVTPLKEYTFDINDYFDLAATEILHDYREGSDFDLHVHFTPNGVDGTDRGVKWQIDYTLANIGSAFPAVTTVSAEATITAATPDRTHSFLDIATVTGTGITIGALIKIRITRIAAVGTAPSADPFGLMVGIHYQVNTLGSTTEAAK